MKNYKQKTRQERQKILHDYREHLIYGENFAPYAATRATAKKFDVEIITVYRAVKAVRKGGDQ